MALTVEQFIEQARKYEEKKVKITAMEVEGFGEIEFQRPSPSVFLKYEKEIVAASGDNFGKEEVDMAKVDMEKLAYESSVFLYNCCSCFREKDVRNMYKNLHSFEEVPLALFGSNEVIPMAQKVFAKFRGKKENEEVVEAVKN